MLYLDVRERMEWCLNGEINNVWEKNKNNKNCGRRRFGQESMLENGG